MSTPLGVDVDTTLNSLDFSVVLSTACARDYLNTEKAYIVRSVREGLPMVCVRSQMAKKDVG